MSRLRTTNQQHFSLCFTAQLTHCSGGSFSQHQVNTAQHPTRTSANDILQWHLSLVPVFLPSLFKQLIGQTHICPFLFFPVTIPEGWMKTLVPGRCRAGAAPATSSRHGTGSDTSPRFFSVLKDHDIRSNQKKKCHFSGC